MRTKFYYLMTFSMILLVFTILLWDCKKEEDLGDQEKPTVSILYPANNSQFVNDATITIRGDAIDNIGISSVSFLIDGIEVATDEAEPYNYEWHLGLTGSHTIKLKAKDEADNIGESSVVSVTIAESEVLKVFGYVKNSINNTIEGAQVSIVSSNKSSESGGSKGSATKPAAIPKVNKNNSIKPNEIPLIDIHKIPKNGQRLEDWITSNYTSPTRHTKHLNKITRQMKKVISRMENQYWMI